jgi:hypothetical protein
VPEAADVVAEEDECRVGGRELHTKTLSPIRTAVEAWNIRPATMVWLIGREVASAADRSRAAPRRRPTTDRPTLLSATVPERHPFRMTGSYTNARDVTYAPAAVEN